MCDDNNVMMLNLVQLLYAASLLIYSFSLKVLDLSRKRNSMKELRFPTLGQDRSEIRSQDRKEERKLGWHSTVHTYTKSQQSESNNKLDNPVSL